MSPLLLPLLPVLSLLLAPHSLGQKLQVGFYAATCPSAETLVATAVSDAVSSDNTIAAALLRLQFHDCFVQGCDGSILIEGGENTSPHHLGIRRHGLEVIDDAKARLEAACPGVVSCADIVALAARDSVVLSGGPNYSVPTGRRDGRVSNPADASELPDVTDSLQQLKDKFVQRGLSVKDFAVLTAAHTIGTSACFFITDRLYGQGKPDPTISPFLLPYLTATCPENGDANVRFPLDVGSPLRFDKQYLRNVRRGFGVLQVDSWIYQDLTTRAVVDYYLSPLSPVYGPSFEADFADAIVRMGMIGVKTGEEGEVRRLCSKFN